jgi:hypothetical protein
LNVGPAEADLLGLDLGLRITLVRFSVSSRLLATRLIICR